MDSLWIVSLTNCFELLANNREASMTRMVKRGARKIRKVRNVMLEHLSIFPKSIEDSEKEREKFVTLNKINKIVCIKSRRESFSFHPAFAG